MEINITTISGIRAELFCLCSTLEADASQSLQVDLELKLLII
jgi:hypothetical protein